MLRNKSTLFDTCVLYHREQYKICLPGILRKNKVLIKTYTVRVFFVLFLLSSYAVQSSRIPGTFKEAYDHLRFPRLALLL